VRKQSVIHPWWLRLTHWLNAIAVIIMVMSGWRIYNATTFLGFHIPNQITLGGWLGGALQWHFAAMWLLGINGLIYLITNIITHRLFSKFFPLSPREIFHDFLSALKGKLSHSDPQKYNGVQKLAYLFVIVDITLLIASGLVLWKSVQFPVLRDLLFGYEGARLIHFGAMTALVGFFIVHIIMVALVPHTLITMIRGR
jgi:thiosulfate reductase cytochrome b subunit